MCVAVALLLVNCVEELLAERSVCEDCEGVVSITVV